MTNQILEINPAQIVSMGLYPNNNGEPCMKIYTAEESHEFSITKGFEVHICNEFLKSLNTGLNVEFQSYKQYSDLIDFNFEILMEYARLNEVGR